MNRQENFYAKNLEDSKKILDKYGFVIYKNVLDKKFLKFIRKNVTEDLRKFGKRQGLNSTALKLPNAAVHMSCLKDIFSHPQIINKLRSPLSKKITNKKINADIVNDILQAKTLFVFLERNVQKGMPKTANRM